MLSLRSSNDIVFVKIYRFYIHSIMNKSSDFLCIHERDFLQTTWHGYLWKNKLDIGIFTILTVKWSCFSHVMLVPDVMKKSWKCCVHKQNKQEIREVHWYTSWNIQNNYIWVTFSNNPLTCFYSDTSCKILPLNGKWVCIKMFSWYT